MDPKLIEQEVDKAIKMLMEHCDNVQIFVSGYNPEADKKTTQSFSKGDGNWFARYGQVREWLVRTDERSRLEVLTEEGEQE